MRCKDWYRKILYLFFRAIRYFFRGLVHLFPPGVFCFVSRPLLKLFIFMAIPRKRIVRNLTAAFGKCYPDVTKDRFARGVQEHIRENLHDCLLQFADSEYARRSISLTVFEHLKSGQKKGKGAMALGAHIGNFVLLGTRIGLEGHVFHAVFRVLPNRATQRVIKRYLSHYHQSVIPSLTKRLAVKTILEALRRNEIGHILGDNLKDGRIDALLFGHRVFCSRGLVRLALRLGAPLIPMHLVRNYYGRMQLVIEPPIEITPTGHLATDIAQNTRRVVCYLETLIRRYPDQWNWLTLRLTKNNYTDLQEPFPREPSRKNTIVAIQEGRNASTHDQIPKDWNRYPVCHFRRTPLLT
jgi:KDO2-lipid IV(A) lauroyltransferase